jgi:hypothetical protein
VEITDPEGKRPLTLTEAAAVQSFQLAEAGYYQIRYANGRQDEIGVNADPKESNLDVIPADVLSLWKGGQGQSPGESASVAQTRMPQSLWWYVMLLVLGAVIAESAIAGRYLGVQRDDGE